MGRRAKNKQSDPAPLTEKSTEKTSSKKLGKRKEVPDEETSRPVKKVKQTNGESKTKTSKDKKDKKSASKKGNKSKGLDDSIGSEEGWEDVDDEYDLANETKYVA